MTKSCHRCTLKTAHWTAEEREGEVRGRRHRAPVHHHNRTEWRERDAGHHCRQCQYFRAGALKYCVKIHVFKYRRDKTGEVHRGSALGSTCVFTVKQCIQRKTARTPLETRAGVRRSVSKENETKGRRGQAG